MTTMRDYELFGVRPRCKACGRLLDEEDCYHDGYAGSPHAHNGAGSSGLGSHHFVFPEVCAGCREKCPACDAAARWYELAKTERMLALWADVGGSLCECDEYWLCNRDDEHLHAVTAFFAWENTHDSREAYVALCKGLRETYGDDYEPPTYVPVNHQPDTTVAEKIYEELLELGLEVTEQGDLREHDCSEMLQKRKERKEKRNEEGEENASVSIL